MDILTDLMRLLRKRTRYFERLAKEALTDELETVYRSKAAEAYSIYVIVYNMKMKMLKERARDAEITDK
jgi:hypothetical protein